MGTDTEEHMKTDRERQLEAALERAELALADWVNTYAPEFCDENNVRRAQSRIEANGGTLAYIADAVKCVREALADEGSGGGDEIDVPSDEEFLAAYGDEPPFTTPPQRRDELGQFGHHADPATDFCVEVECLQGIEIDCIHGLQEWSSLYSRLERAMAFRVGGDAIAVRAKDELRAIAERVRERRYPSQQRRDALAAVDHVIGAVKRSNLHFDVVLTLYAIRRALTQDTLLPYIERLQNERDEALAEKNELKRRLGEPAVPEAPMRVRRALDRISDVQYTATDDGRRELAIVEQAIKQGQTATSSVVQRLRVLNECLADRTTDKEWNEIENIADELNHTNHGNARLA